MLCNVTDATPQLMQGAVSGLQLSLVTTGTYNFSIVLPYVYIIHTRHNQSCMYTVFQDSKTHRFKHHKLVNIQFI